MNSRAPLIVAIVLLVLPVLYVGSYFALVIPPNYQVRHFPFGFEPPTPNYRWGGDWSDRMFWPLEQIDRKVRPEAWEVDLDFRFNTGDFDLP